MLFFVLILFSFIFSGPVFATSTPYLTELNVGGSQWVEIYNPGDASVNLNGWKIGNQSGPQTTITSLEIGATSYAVFTIDPTIFKVEDSNYVELWNDSNSIYRAPSYSPNTLSDRSWSRQTETNWCVANSSKGTQNNSCYVSATVTPTLTPTPKPTIEIAPTLEPTTIPKPTAVLSIQPESVGTTTISEPTPKSKNLGLIFIIIGALLLISPLLITKIQQWKIKSPKR